MSVWSICGDLTVEKPVQNVLTLSPHPSLLPPLCESSSVELLLKCRFQVNKQHVGEKSNRVHNQHPFIVHHSNLRIPIDHCLSFGLLIIYRHSRQQNRSALRDKIKKASFSSIDHCEAKEPRCAMAKVSIGSKELAIYKVLGDGEKQEKQGADAIARAIAIDVKVESV